MTMVSGQVGIKVRVTGRVRIGIRIISLVRCAVTIVTRVRVRIRVRIGTRVRFMARIIINFGNRFMLTDRIRIHLKKLYTSFLAKKRSEEPSYQLKNNLEQITEYIRRSVPFIP